MNDENLELAKKARLNAYAPYTKYCVGAALKSKSGKVYLGCNIENHGLLSICAERTAFASAISQGESEFESITIVGANEGEEPNKMCMPCGYCRQFMSEFVDENFKIRVQDGEGVKELSIKDLLPYGYTF